MKKPIQILVIHGGSTFENKNGYLRYLKTRKISLEKRIDWKDGYLAKELGRGFKVILPRMPLREDARYVEWKIHFERFVPHMKNKYILIGNSLGGIFLAKYLSENKLPKKALSTYLVCPPFDDALSANLSGGFKLKLDISLVEKNTKNLCLMFSKDDDVVPVSHAEKYRKKLNNAKLVIYKSKNGHFRISKFPEIVKMIKKDAASA